MYEVKQIILKEKFISEFENLLNEYAEDGFTLDSFQSNFIGSSDINNDNHRQVITAVFRKDSNN